MRRLAAIDDRGGDEDVADRLRGSIGLSSALSHPTRSTRFSVSRTAIHSGPNKTHRLRRLVHAVEEDVLRDPAQPARTGLLLHGEGGDGAESRGRKAAMRTSVQSAQLARLETKAERASERLGSSARGYRTHRSSTPLVENSSQYCLTSAFFGSVSTRRRSCSVSERSAAVIGRRPMSSGMRPKDARSDGSHWSSRCERSGCLPPAATEGPAPAPR